MRSGAVQTLASILGTDALPAGSLGIVVLDEVDALADKHNLPATTSVLEVRLHVAAGAPVRLAVVLLSRLAAWPRFFDPLHNRPSCFLCPQRQPQKLGNCARHSCVLPASMGLSISPTVPTASLRL